MEQIFNSKVKCLLFRSFYENYSCVRCILRALKVSQPEIYQQRHNYEELIEGVSKKLDVKSLLTEYGYDSEWIIRHGQVHKKGELCRICLGIMQSVDQKGNIEKIVHDVKLQDFEFEAFKIFVKVPLSTQLRMLHFLRCGEEEILADGKQIVTEEEQKELTSLTSNWKENFIDIKQSFKWVVPELMSTHFKVPATSAADCPFVIKFGIKADSEDIAQFAHFRELIDQLNEKSKKKLKNNQSEDVNLPRVDAISLNLDRISQLPRSQFLMIRKNQLPDPVLTPATIEISATHQSIYFMGNYCKYSRYMSQTPWYIDGVKLYDTSIQEEIAEDIIPNFKCNSYKFSSGGREDIDVRMLGNGRPFVIEVVDPRRVHSLTDKDLKMYEEQLNAKKTELKVYNLHFTDVKCFMVLKTSEIEKIKSYACIVQTRDVVSAEKIEHLNSLKDIALQQKTPIRVLHRRTQMVRTKYIYRIRAFQIGEKHLIVYVLSSAGTYIKEFIHGDLERTTPNLGTFLGTESDIFQLDVVKLYPQLDEESIKDFEEVCTPPRSITHWE